MALTDPFPDAPEASDAYLFRELPTLESAGLSISASSFDGYRQSLDKQLRGRTTALDQILSPMEARVQRIVSDLARMRQDGASIGYVLFRK
jgi:hypothetical protein